MSGGPYRSPSLWSPEAVGWTSDSHRAEIGGCLAVVRVERPAKLPAYWTWKVTRDDHVTMHGSAKTLEQALAAAERAAALLNEDGWPSAFTATGVVDR